MSPAGTGIYIGIKHGQPVAKEYDDRQLKIGDNVTDIDKKK